ncbi:MAG: TlpA family protein disulfide reductase [Microbacteriaceae bacterium]
MNPLETAAVLAGLVTLATLLGLIWRSRDGHLRLFAGNTTRISLAGVVPIGSKATLLQFSTPVCAPCRSTHAVLSALASELGGPDEVRHIEVDLTERPEIASRFNILQSPTTFILDGDGVLQARIGGRPARGQVEAELQRILVAAGPGRPVRVAPGGWEELA